VNEEREDSGHGHRRHEHSCDEPLAHDTSILGRTPHASLKNS
jgi:hypothetical protein